MLIVLLKTKAEIFTNLIKQNKTNKMQNNLYLKMIFFHSVNKCFAPPRNNHKYLV